MSGWPPSVPKSPVSAIIPRVFYHGGVKVCHLLAEDAGPYASKCSEIDIEVLRKLGITRGLCTLGRSALSAEGLDASLRDLPSFDAVLVYGASRIPQAILRRLRRCVVDEPVLPSLMTRLARWAPAVVTTPIPEQRGTRTHLPEAVSSSFFESEAFPEGIDEGHGVVGFVHRAGATEALIASIGSRIGRFRDDIHFCEFASIPSRAELATVNVWLDPAVDNDDLGGGTAEALVAGLPVVASRTPINVLRLDNGKSGFLVPPGDANEFVHVTLNALFKPETTRANTESTRSHIDQFRPEHRASALQHILRMLEDH